jgi:hypothetical protein
MADFGATPGRQRIASIAQGSGTDMLLLTAPGTNNTKSAWTEVSASTPFDAAGFWVNVYHTGTTGFQLLDIGIGGPGSEIVLLPDWPCMRPAMPWGLGSQWIPLRIPAGSRVVARYQASAVAGATMKIGMVLAAESFAGGTFDRCVALNINSANSFGTNKLDLNGTPDTEGAWTEMSAAVPFDVKALLWIPRCHTSQPAANVAHRFDIGIGAAASEVEIVSDLPSYSNSSVLTPYHHRYLLPISIPAGVRLSARQQVSGIAAADGNIYPSIHLFG